MLGQNFSTYLLQVLVLKTKKEGKSLELDPLTCDCAKPSYVKVEGSIYSKSKILDKISQKNYSRRVGAMHFHVEYVTIICTRVYVRRPCAIN